MSIKSKVRKEFKPVNLGEISFLEIISLEKPYNSFIVNETEAQTIAHLFRQLPEGESYRCHIPAYAFKFHLCDTTTIYTDLCWQCHSAGVEIRKNNELINKTAFTFDAKSKPAIELLEICSLHLPPS